MATATTARRIVREIPRINLFDTTATQTQRRLLQVAAYARVSTEKEEQEDNFERQVEHYTQMIASNKDWEKVDIYADPGISGTRAEKRPNFMRMINDCRAGKIEKVLVKSISRFARNTVDALQYIRELKDLGISVYFESENIDTLTPGGEVLITILAAMAEQESRTISTNIKWAWQRKFQNGEIILNTGLMLGYKKNGKDENCLTVYVIDEAEAEIVRRIYREFIEGITVTRICKRLEADGILTPLGKTHWQHNVVESILTNEKYTGNAILGKTYKPDVLTKHRKKNDGEKAPMYYVENTHPAIIDKEMFEMAQAEMKNRREAGTRAVGNSRFTSKYPFSGLLVCGECGAMLRRQVRTMGTGERVASWGCSYRIVNGRAACDSHHVREDVMEKTYAAAIKQMADNAAEVIEAVREGTQLAMQPDNAEEREVVEQEIIELQETALTLHKNKQSGLIAAEAYDTEIRACSERMKELEARQAEMKTAATRYAEVKTWIDAFEQGLQDGSIAETDDAGLMKTLVERITVNSDGIEVEFKCGARVQQKYVR
ncbi:MAG: recombinase family protein [Eubacteriales bacterium]